MARKPTAAAEKHGPDFVGATPAALAATEVVMHQAQSIAQEMGEERDLLNQLLGQAQMAEAFGKFSQTVWSSKLAYVKENKLYRALKGKKTPNGLELQGTWDEFCGLLGVSDEKANQDITNLRAFGEEALESMSRMGIGYRELLQYRKLPEDQKIALIEVAKAGDKDSFLELAEDLIAKHTKEKEAAAAALADKQADLDATEKLLADTRDALDQAKRAKAKLELRTAPWESRVDAFKDEIGKRQALIDKLVGAHLEGVTALDVWYTQEACAAPDYDPESSAPMPPAVQTVLLTLSDAIDRCAALVGALQNELDTRFGADIEDARRHLLREPASAQEAA
ncbi:MAG: hypothetical protein ACK4KV_19145 [Rhodocyclaceae bacterium]